MDKGRVGRWPSVAHYKHHAGATGNHSNFTVATTSMVRLFGETRT